jgi:1,6-anhydro-N-acetylmuramate kinase
LFSNGIKSFCRKHDIRQSAIHLVGTHAQIPNRVPRLETHNADTHPYGWNRTVATETGITTVFEFNVLEFRDPRPHIPPVAFADRTLLTHREKFRVCLNIDQLANLTFIPPSADQSVSRTQFRDCGPGTLFIDYAVRYGTANGTGEDHNGDLAAHGTINQELVDRTCNNRYLHTAPPLSMAAEMFGDHEAQHLIDECLALKLCGADMVATITRITAHNILKQYRRALEELFPPDQRVDELFICGRGARNPNIIDYLESELPENVITKPLDDVGIPGDANEAVCCAHLAFEAMLCQTTRRLTRSQKEPSPHTRQDAPFVGGKVVRGAEWDTLLASIQRFSKGEQLCASTDVRVVQP